MCELLLQEAQNPPRQERGHQLGKDDARGRNLMQWLNRCSILWYYLPQHETEPQHYRPSSTKHRIHFMIAKLLFGGSSPQVRNIDSIDAICEHFLYPFTFCWHTSRPLDRPFLTTKQTYTTSNICFYTTIYSPSRPKLVKKYKPVIRQYGPHEALFRITCMWVCVIWGCKLPINLNRVERVSENDFLFYRPISKSLSFCSSLRNRWRTLKKLDRVVQFYEPTTCVCILDISNGPRAVPNKTIRKLQTDLTVSWRPCFTAEN